MMSAGAFWGTPGKSVPDETPPAERWSLTARPANRPVHDAGPAQMGDKASPSTSMAWATGEATAPLYRDIETETRDFPLERPGGNTLLSGPAAGKGLEVTGTERREKLRFSSWPGIGFES